MACEGALSSVGARPSSSVLTRIAASVDGLTKSNASAVANLNETQRQAETLARELARTLDELRDVWRQHAGRFDHVDEELGKAFDKMLEGAKGNAQAIRDFVIEIDARLAESVGRVGGAVEELGEFTQDIRDIADKLAQAKRQAA